MCHGRVKAVQPYHSPAGLPASPCYHLTMQSTGRFTKELKRLMADSYDSCKSCGSALPHDVAAYAGYDERGQPLYIGNCCLPKVAELASHIYWWWTADKRVAPNEKLWRYIDFAKFIHLLETRSLFFSRADKFEDTFEGVSGLAERQVEWDNHYREYFKRAVRYPPDNAPSPPEEIVEQEAERLLRDIKQSIEWERKSTFVSCWHSNTGESEALWRLYCPNGSTGVAIETSATKLLDALDAPDIELGRVQYVDFRMSFAGFHDRIFWKRKSLAHEAEVRAVSKQHFTEVSSGLARLVDVERLCASVVPSPFAGAWFPGLVEAVVARYGYKIPVGKSELLGEPFF